MLNLASETDPSWAARAVGHLDEILIDHAHCEKKAASTAVSLLFRYPERSELLAPLAQLAREELAHFELLLAHLDARGLALARQVPSPYAAALMKAIRPAEPQRGLDTLLCLALIEARSCERMKRLAEALPPGKLQQLYRGLLVSEAQHHQAYVDLAASFAAPTPVRDRLRELARHEAGALAATPAMARLHCS